MWRLLDEDCLGDADEYVTHFMRRRPVDDDEAEIIEAICLAATPGPLVTDEVSDGGGALVATLPDGRNVVSVSPPAGSPADARCMAAANLQLICEARCLLLRLLEDRRRWGRREQELSERIRALEEQLERDYEEVGQAAWPPADPAPSHPR
jgi:hypothetical protein